MKTILSLSALLITLTLTAQSNPATWYLNDTSANGIQSDTNTASGDYSMATGYENIASGQYSTARGEGTIASGGWSTATGRFTIAEGDNSFAMGVNSVASGYYSLATGNGAKETPTASIAKV